MATDNNLRKRIKHEDSGMMTESNERPTTPPRKKRPAVIRVSLNCMAFVALVLSSILLLASVLKDSVLTRRRISASLLTLHVRSEVRRSHEGSVPPHTTKIAHPKDSKFMLPDELEPGDIMPLVWKEDNKQADTYARLVGLPPELTQEIYKFCQEAGLIDFFHKLVYESPLDHGARKTFTLAGGRKWSVSGPSGNWKNSDMHWIDPTNEELYEETLQVLKKGNFDAVLDAIGGEFQPDGLMYGSIGFIVVSHCRNGKIHPDVPEVGQGMFNILFPLVLPDKGKASLRIGDEEEPKSRNAPVDFTPDLGILMSGDTWHATGNCDYRDTGGIRVAVSIFLSDVNEDNVKTIAADDTAQFPVHDTTDWFMAQKGRIWGNGNSLKMDKGRKPFHVEDEDEDCPALAAQGECEADPQGMRVRCLKSCKVFIDDERYFTEFFPTTK